ncbi:MAG: transposase family protein [Clostridiales bacterium]|jgi:preprotein translocase subunit SecE|nr:transposase family protein [Clostridiales bacterium]
MFVQTNFFSNPKGRYYYEQAPMNNQNKKRQMREEKNLARELKKTINHFFPELLTKLRNVKDPRNQSYITYNISVILLIRILSAIFMLASMRKMTEEFNR